MKLRNKISGEIEDFIEIVNIDNRLFARICTRMGSVYKKELHSLAELNEEWEDYEEPKVYYYISDFGAVRECEIGKFPEDEEDRKAIGNYFETKEEAEKAVEKLKAWKRIKDKGFKIDLWDYDGGNYQERISTGRILFRVKDYEENDEDLDLLFGGEE